VRLDVSIKRIIEDLPDSAQIGLPSAVRGIAGPAWPRAPALDPACGCRRLTTPAGLAAAVSTTEKMEAATSVNNERRNTEVSSNNTPVAGVDQ
jgi:hypothetical protein